MALEPGTYAHFNTTEGKITVRLFEADAPVTVKNFIELAEGQKEWTHPGTREKSSNKLYDGTIFHRVISNFMIQGGGMLPGLKEKKTGAPIKNESSNGLSNKRGTIAMARLPDADSATAQFFINVKDNPGLNKSEDSAGYAVFGQVIQGMDVVDKIKEVKTGRQGGHEDVPLEDVVIRSVRRVAK